MSSGRYLNLLGPSIYINIQVDDIIVYASLKALSIANLGKVLRLDRTTGYKTFCREDFYGMRLQNRAVLMS